MDSRSDAGGMLTRRTPSNSMLFSLSTRYVKAPPPRAQRQSSATSAILTLRFAATASGSEVRIRFILVGLPLERARFVDETLKESAYSLAGERTFICRDYVV